MSYLQEFKKQINEKNFSKFLVLWEEYCANDRVSAAEFIEILEMVQDSDFKKSIGQIMEMAIPLWKLIEDSEKSYRVIQRIIDLQSTNSPALAEIALEELQKRHENEEEFQDRLRLIGLREKVDFQGAISSYELLAHMKQGNVVFHKTGWGTGEIMGVSRLREHLDIEFENISGKKDLSFTNAFKTLIPLSKEHFLARRFIDPDYLEEEAKKDPVKIIKMLLQDLGPKNAAEIKDEMSELVIPEKEYSKWWQNLRAKLKKDPLIEVPENPKNPFYLRQEKITDEEIVEKAIEEKRDLNSWIISIYNLLRDQPSSLKNPKTKQEIIEKLKTALKEKEITLAHSLSILILLETFLQHKPDETSFTVLLHAIDDLSSVIQDIEILAFKKKVLSVIKEEKENWETIFLSLLFHLHQSMLKDYLFQELMKGKEKEKLIKKLENLSINPKESPETFLWYFQKIFSSKKENLPFQDDEGRKLFFEALLILYHQLEWDPDAKDAVKKAYHLLSDKRFFLVREILKETDVEFAKEFLLLASKCQTIPPHDHKILRSLVEVAHPNLKKASKERYAGKLKENVIWTTEEAYLRTQEKIKYIGTVEIVQNAKEIEAARALGDLRENSEYKFALERRSMLQNQLRMLSQQLNKARILTTQDISLDEVDVGTIVELQDLNGKTIQYTILGPWDADPEKNILSFQSQFAQAMLGYKKGESFSFREDSYKVLAINNFLEVRK